MCFSLAPNSTSYDALTVKSVPAALATDQPAVITSSPFKEDLNTEASGDEREGPIQGLPGDLTVTNVSRNTLKLSWSAPKGMFDSFTIELNSSSKEMKSKMIEVLGETREVDIDGLSPGMRYDITLYGMTKGEKSQPINVHVKTGTSVSKTICHLP